MTRTSGKSSRGNALMEYVIPMAVLLIAVGILTTIFDINGLVADYFLAASGHTSESVVNKTFSVEPMSKYAMGPYGNGTSGFNDQLATITDGKGAVPSPAITLTPSGGSIAGLTLPPTAPVTAPATSTTTSPTPTTTATTPTSTTTTTTTATTPTTTTATPTTTATTPTSTTTTTTAPAVATTATVAAPLTTYVEAMGPYKGQIVRSGARPDVASATGGERLFLFDNERTGTMRPAPTPPTVTTATVPATTTVTDPTATTTTPDPTATTATTPVSTATPVATTTPTTAP